MKIRRKCDICNQSFKPMTEKQWQHVKHNMHDLMSIRHKNYKKLKINR